MSRTKRSLRPSLFLCFLLFSSFFSSLCSLPLHTLNTPSLLHSHSLIHYLHSLIHFTLLSFELSLCCPISIHCPAGLSFQLDSHALTCCIPHNLFHSVHSVHQQATGTTATNKQNKTSFRNTPCRHRAAAAWSRTLVPSFFLPS
jgi:hypothetical protein